MQILLMLVHVMAKICHVMANTHVSIFAFEQNLMVSFTQMSKFTYMQIHVE